MKLIILDKQFTTGSFLVVGSLLLCRSTLQPIAVADKTSEKVIQNFSALDEAIKAKLVTGAKKIEKIDIPYYLCLHDEDEDDTMPQFDPIEPEAAMPEADEFDVKAFDRGHSNPIIDTHLYQVQFPNGHVEKYSANLLHRIYFF